LLRSTKAHASWIKLLAGINVAASMQALFLLRRVSQQFARCASWPVVGIGGQAQHCHIAITAAELVHVISVDDLTIITLFAVCSSGRQRNL
jgi:hypothetical protein